MDTPTIIFIIAIAVFLGYFILKWIFYLIRESILWYYKINELVSNQRETITLLGKINTNLEAKHWNDSLPPDKIEKQSILKDSHEYTPVINYDPETRTTGWTCWKCGARNMKDKTKCTNCGFEIS